MALRDSLNPHALKFLSILRIISGLIFMAHGTGKHLGIPTLPFTLEAGSPPWIGRLDRTHLRRAHRPRPVHAAGGVPGFGHAWRWPISWPMPRRARFPVAQWR